MNVPLSLFVFCFCICLSGAEEKKPNILFISIDDLRPQIGACGLEFMKTPNLDQFAKEGRLFERHYVQVATCGPSRACLLTGKNLKNRHEASNGYFEKQLMANVESEGPETFIHHFKNSGYHTVGMGKISHNEAGGTVGADGAMKKLALPRSWNEFVPIIMDDGWGGSLLHGYASGTAREEKPMPPFEALDLPDERYPDGILTRNAVAKLSELAKKEEPFLMAVGFMKPHLPFVAPKKYWDLYERDEIPISPNPEAPDGVDQLFLHNSGEFFNQYKDQPEKGGAGVRLSDDYARQLVHGYCASVSFVDAQVGKVLAALEKEGLADETIVVVWGDHGWHLGDHTIWGKHSSFDRAVKSLLMVKTPEMKKAGTSTRGLVATVDLYPTLCELAGLGKPEGLEGKSFVEQLEDPAAKGKEYVVSFWRRMLSLRTDRYRMALYRKNDMERVMLFDHQEDPNEAKNVADENPETVAKLRKLMLKGHGNYLPELDKAD